MKNSLVFQTLPRRVSLLVILYLRFTLPWPPSGERDDGGEERMEKNHPYPLPLFRLMEQFMAAKILKLLTPNHMTTEAQPHLTPHYAPGSVFHAVAVAAS